MDSFDSHKVRLDKSGKLLSWYSPQSHAYDHIMKLAWEFIRKVPVEENGLKTYLAYSTFFREPPYHGRTWPHHPPGLYAMFVDSVVKYYPYSGDADLIGIVREMVDYPLEHGLTPGDWVWPRIPFASSDSGAVKYQGADESIYTMKPPPHNYLNNLRPGTGDGIGVIEPDKISEFGFALTQFYRLTGERKYMDWALHFADVLSANARRGSFNMPPWPFRAYGLNGVAREEYTSNMVAHVKLLDEVIKEKDKAAYRKAKKAAWDWLVDYPLRNNKWKGYFEDVMLDPMDQNREQYTALETARYLLTHREKADPNWKARAKRILDWVELTFGDRMWKATFINEQLRCFWPMASHTARYASVCALWYEVTGDEKYREEALGSLNASTYFVREDGMVDTFHQRIVHGDDVIIHPDDPWFSDGYADYIRHIMSTFGSIPSAAPPDEDHILRSSSVISEVSYAEKDIRYQTLGAPSEEVLHLTFAPRKVEVDGRELERMASGKSGWSFDARTRTLRVVHPAGRTRIHA